MAYSGVTVPEISVDLGDRLAGVGVDQLDIHVEGDTLLGFDNVLTNKLTRDVYTALVGVCLFREMGGLF